MPGVIVVLSGICRVMIVTERRVGGIMLMVQRGISGIMIMTERRVSGIMFMTECGISGIVIMSECGICIIMRMRGRRRPDIRRLQRIAAIGPVLRRMLTGGMQIISGDIAMLYSTHLNSPPRELCSLMGQLALQGVHKLRAPAHG